MSNHWPKPRFQLTVDGIIITALGCLCILITSAYYQRNQDYQALLDMREDYDSAFCHARLQVDSIYMYLGRPLASSIEEKE